MIGIGSITKVKKLHEDAKMPEYANVMGDSGADVFAIEDYTIEPGERALVKTGIAIQLQDGTECQVRSKSGLALKKGLAVLNSPGTVDNIYRGEVGVIIINHSKETQEIKKGEKVAQLVIAHVEQSHFMEADTLTDTDRGVGGYGSTGK